MSLDYSYINKNGRKVSGAPAFNHYVYTVCGGISKYNDEVGYEYIKEFVKFNTEIINNNIERKVKKEKFKIAK